MTSAKLLLYKEKTEKKSWMVLISADYGNKRVLEYLREKGSNIMIV